MTFLKSRFVPFVMLFAVIVAASCKTKKIVPQPVAKPVEVAKPAPAPVAKAPEPVKQEEPAPVAAPDYNFNNIQFEFNSGILKTDAYPILDKAAAEMKKDASVKFLLGGHSSAEGTDEHNMSLSVERANAVKTYLVNTGVNADILTVKGYGETKPVTTNKDEAGRALNRRVEIKKQ
jgi:OOP family OmpA-OmpF porin